MNLTATPWATVEDKARGLDKLKKFVSSGFDKKKFTPSLYTILVGMFGHIAHYDRDGFWNEWFETEAGRLRWMTTIMRCRAVGDPSYTWSDVETLFIEWMRSDAQLNHMEALAENVLVGQVCAAAELLDKALANAMAHLRPVKLGRIRVICDGVSDETMGRIRSLPGAHGLLGPPDDQTRIVYMEANSMQEAAMQLLRVSQRAV